MAIPPRAAADSQSFYRVQQIDGVWWWIDPNGGKFISKGVNHISYTADHAPALGYSPYEKNAAAKYGSKEAWADAAVQRLQGWGFNTAGAWSNPETWRRGIAYTPIIDIVFHTGGDWRTGRFPDIFAPDFRGKVERRAEEVCRPLKEDPNLLGYFTDNELRWGPDWRSPKTLFHSFWEMPAEAAGRQTVFNFTREHYGGSLDALNAAWGTSFESWEKADALGSLDSVASSDGLAKVESAFLRLTAETYYRTAAEAIRKHDPNHAVVGCRHGGYAMPEVIESMRGYVDVVSYNHYGDDPPAETLERIHQMTGAPVMLTEFSFKAVDSGLPNTRGAGDPVPTQKDRADGFEQYVTQLMRLPYVIGYHWFEHADEPAEGRFDGENGNHGVVNIQDEPWEILTERMKQINAQAEAIHECSGERSEERLEQ